MSLVSDTAPVAFRADAPGLIERGVDTTLLLRPSRAGVAIAPTAATFTLIDKSGSTVINAASASVSADRASYTVAGSTTASLLLGDRWTIIWSVTLTGESVARAVRQEAAMVRTRLYPVVTDQDLFRRHRAIDPSGSVPITRITDFSDYLDDAWATIQEWLLASGDRPWLVISSHSTRDVHISLTLAYVYEDLAVRNPDAYRETADSWMRRARDAYDRMRLVYDRSDEGDASGADKGRKGPGGPLWLGGSRAP